MPDLDDLLVAGRLESIEPDPGSARLMLAEGERHLDSAAAILDQDPNGAYQLLYDGARKAVAAHMLSRGFRAANPPGAHAAVAVYAVAELGRGAIESDARRFDRLRRNRNRSE